MVKKIRNIILVKSLVLAVVFGAGMAVYGENTSELTLLEESEYDAYIVQEDAEKDAGDGTVALPEDELVPSEIVEDPEELLFSCDDTERITISFDGGPESNWFSGWDGDNLCYIYEGGSLYEFSVDAGEEFEMPDGILLHADGKRVMGWLDPATGTMYEFKEKTSFTASTTLTAVWQDEITLTYEGGAGSAYRGTWDNDNMCYSYDGGTTYTEALLPGEKVTILNKDIFKADGRQIVRWQDSATGEEYDFYTEHEFTVDTVLKAVWEDEITITFYGGPGSICKREASEFYHSTVSDDGTAYTVTTIPAEKVWILSEDSFTKEDEYIIGWVDLETGKSYEMYQEYSFQSSTTLTAVWEDYYKFILDPNGGYWENNYPVNENGTLTKYFEKDWDTEISAYNLPCPKREGKVFVGWACDAESTDIKLPYIEWCYRDPFRIPIESMYLYAVWEDPIVISWDPNGGTWEDGSTEIRTTVFGPGDYISKDNDPGDVICPDDEKVFVGWSMSPDGEIWYRDGNDIAYVEDDTQSMTVYAVYKTVITLTLDGGEGSRCMWGNASTYVYETTEGARFYLGNNIFSREGYILTGWVEDGAPDNTYPVNQSAVLHRSMKLNAVWRRTAASATDILVHLSDGTADSMSADELASVLQDTTGSYLLTQLANQAGNDTDKLNSELALLALKLDEQLTDESGTGDPSKKIISTGSGAGAYVCKTETAVAGGISVEVAGAAATVASMIRNGKIAGIEEDAHYQAAVSLTIEERSEAELRMDISLHIQKADTHAAVVGGEVQPTMPVSITLTLPEEYVGYDLQLIHIINRETDMSEEISYSLVNEGTQIRFIARSLSPFELKRGNCRHSGMTHTGRQDATCAKEGHKEYWECSNCGKLFSDSEGKTELNAEDLVIEKNTVHKWDSGKVTKAATEDTTGIRTYTCTICKQKKTSVIPKAAVNITIGKKPAKVKVKAGKKGKVTLTWTKLANKGKTKALYKQVDKIEIQYSTDKNFAAGVVKKELGKKKAKQTIKLKQKTTYYFRIRYKDRNGGCSSWVKKTVKTKK